MPIRRPADYIRALLRISYLARRTLNCTSEVKVPSHIRPNIAPRLNLPLDGQTGNALTIQVPSSLLAPIEIVA